ncbi:MAG: hypothetical protein KDC87_01220 [Planctomycetes bacterium]|nr:hypothetical protein [Planctomycetota bacterium]MCB9871878.1 hypothetical protein [Planctomycetota bacterium]MCB9888828.1 hypothetical protein [Planctomycetota bacterium]
MNAPVRCVVAVLATAFACSGQAQSPATPAARGPERTKVVVVGASVSAGFEDPTSRGSDGAPNRSYRLDVALKKIWSRDVARVYSGANFLMFTDPTGYGRRQIDSAKKVRADLVLGIDFPFWFGYGPHGREAAGVLEGRRLAAQAKCLAMLEELDCPLLIGDYPDMRGASHKMLPARMVPNKVTLAQLNHRLLAWAAKRPKVRVLSLADFVAKATTQPMRLDYAPGRTVTFPKYFLLQSDRLHATRLGVLVLVRQIRDVLPQLLPKAHPLLAVDPTLCDLVQATGLADQLPAGALHAATAVGTPQGAGR